MKTLVFHSFWIATDLIRCPMVLGKNFEPPRVHRGCTGDAQGMHRGSDLQGVSNGVAQGAEVGVSERANYSFESTFKICYFCPIWTQFGINLTQLGPFDLFCANYAAYLNELSVALFHQNLKLAAGFIFKNGYMSINITG